MNLRDDYELDTLLADWKKSPVTKILLDHFLNKVGDLCEKKVVSCDSDTEFVYSLGKKDGQILVMKFILSLDSASFKNIIGDQENE